VSVKIDTPIDPAAANEFPNPNNAHAARLRPGGRRAFCVAGIASSVLRLY